MHRFRAPNRWFLILLLMVMLPMRAALASVPADGVPASTADEPSVSMLVMPHGDASCCPENEGGSGDGEAGVCSANCACCAVLAAGIGQASATGFPTPPTTVLGIPRTTQPVPLRPPRLFRS